MEDTLTQLVKEANKPKHASVRKSCQEALGILQLWNYLTVSFVEILKKTSNLNYLMFVYECKPSGQYYSPLISYARTCFLIVNK